MASSTSNNEIFESGTSDGFEPTQTLTGSSESCSKADFVSAEPSPAPQSNALVKNDTYSLLTEQTEQIKLYTKDECDKLGGIWHENGECTKYEGGSFSWDNRRMNQMQNQNQNYTVKIHLKDSTLEYRNVLCVSVYKGETKIM